ncbi:MAG: hypothetical protein LH624_19225 [Cryobacterium sp.]|nr:hypothetical protein [Cryobacterium sp.]
MTGRVLVGRRVGAVARCRRADIGQADGRPAGQDSASLAEGSRQVLAAGAGLPHDRLASFVFPRMFGGLRAPAMLADLLPVAED